MVLSRTLRNRPFRRFLVLCGRRMVARPNLLSASRRPAARVDTVNGSLRLAREGAEL